jgi:arylsulfatase A-like enzyme
LNSSQPNILFIFADQLSARWLPVYGNHTVKAPVLQDLASKSSVFTQAYTNSPLCTPYRACLLTGLYASQTQVTENGQCFDDDQKTLAHYLNDLNYETHYIGKWHLSGAPHKNRWIPPNKRAGFKHFIGWESHHVDHNKGLIWKDNPDNHIELKGHETDGLTEIVCQELKEINQNKPFFMTVSYQAPHAPSSPPKKYYDLKNF